MGEGLTARAALDMDDEERPRHAVAYERKRVRDAVTLDAITGGHPLNHVSRDARRSGQNGLLEFAIPQLGRLAYVKMV